MLYNKFLLKEIFILITFSFILFITGCTNDNDIKESNFTNEINAELEKTYDENRELASRIEALNELIVTKDNIISELNEKTEQANSLEYYIVKTTKFHGYGIPKQKNIELKTLPFNNSKSFLSMNGTVEIIGEVKTLNNENWLLVKDFEGHTYGYIKATDLEKSGYIRKFDFEDVSSMSIFDLRLGDTESDMIKQLGSDFTLTNLTVYTTNVLATYFADESKDIGRTEIIYDSVTKIVNRIHTSNKNYKVNGLYGAGDNVEEAIVYFNHEYKSKLYEDYYVIEDVSGCFLTLYFNEKMIITAITYKRNEIDA